MTLSAQLAIRNAKSGTPIQSGLFKKEWESVSCHRIVCTWGDSGEWRLSGGKGSVEAFAIGASDGANTFGSELTFGVYKPDLIDPNNPGLVASRISGAVVRDGWIGVATGGAGNAMRAGQVGLKIKVAFGAGTAYNAYQAADGVATGIKQYQGGGYLWGTTNIGLGLVGLGGEYAVLRNFRAADNAAQVRGVNQINGANPPQSAPNSAAAAGKVNLNSNSAVLNFGLYEIEVNSALHKVGKADLNRVTQSSGLPTRLHQQLRKLREIHGKTNVDGQVVDELGNVSTAAVKAAENARIQRILDETGSVPPGNSSSFRP